MKLSILFATLLAIAACTSAGADRGVAVATIACDGLVVASGQPGLAPICATIKEVEEAYKALRASGVLGAQAPLSQADLYREIIKRRATK